MEEYLQPMLQTFPLHQAAREGRISVMKDLIRRGYDVNSMEYDRVTALHEACLAGQLESVKFLIENGAEVNFANIDSSTPLCDACAGGHANCVRFLLDNGALVNPPFVLSTPLHEAALRGNGECVRLLIESNAAIEARDCHVGTPLHAACSRFIPNVHCVEELLRAGADVDAPQIQKRPLHCAVASGSPQVVERLLAFGADPHLKDNQGFTPKERAQRGSRIHEILEQYERNPRPLLLLCCRVIRRAIGPATRVRLRARRLGLPSALTRYVVEI